MLIEIESQNDVCILHLKGHFVMGTDPAYLRSKADEIKTRDCSKLLVDLSEVSVVGSTVIGFVVGLYTTITKKADGRFILAGANSFVRQVLDVTRLSTVIPLAVDTGSALAALRGEDPAARTVSTTGSPS
jgi:anti-anti-sigma factor